MPAGTWPRPVSRPHLWALTGLQEPGRPRCLLSRTWPALTHFTLPSMSCAVLLAFLLWGRGSGRKEFAQISQLLPIEEEMALQSRGTSHRGEALNLDMVLQGAPPRLNVSCSVRGNRCAQSEGILAQAMERVGSDVSSRLGEPRESSLGTVTKLGGRASISQRGV